MGLNATNIINAAIIIITIIACIIYGVKTLHNFIAQSPENQRQLLYHMLYSLVIKAETQLGSKTGQAKLAMVIEYFLAECPKDLRNLLSTDQLVDVIDQLVDLMDEYFKENVEVRKRLLGE
jgi:hypothetical protein